jgi:hypothetical protein
METENGAVKIEVVGLPLNDHEVLWMQDLPNGMRMATIANAEFAGVILQRMQATREAEIRQQKAEQFMQGMQGR